MATYGNLFVNVSKFSAAMKQHFLSYNIFYIRLFDNFIQGEIKLLYARKMQNEQYIDQMENALDNVKKTEASFLELQTDHKQLVEENKKVLF